MKSKVWVGIGIFILMFGILLIATDKTPTTGQVIGDDQVIIDGTDPVVLAKEIPTDKPKIQEIQPSTIEAKIINFAFTPTSIEINVGDTIIWENKDSLGHTVTSDTGEELNSRLLSQGQKYQHTFLTVGEYPYYCKPHPYMRGKVVVK